MHVLHLLMNIMLYREYLAFLPFGIDRPIGPLDEPKIPADQGEPAEGPERYWAKQAGACFGSARNIINLLSACDSKDALVETPLIGFATWIAVTCCKCEKSSRELDRAKLLQAYTVFTFLKWTYTMHWSQGQRVVMATRKLIPEELS